jgi:hypothetical protein
MLFFLCLAAEKVVERRKIEASLKIISSNSIPVTLGLKLSYISIV